MCRLTILLAVFAWLAVAVACAGGPAYRPDGASASLAALERALAAAPDARARWQLAGDFHAALGLGRPYPLVEDGRVHLFAWDTTGAGNLSLVGPGNRWNPAAQPLRRLAGTPLLHVALPFEPFTAIAYKFARGKDWVSDPLNPLRRPDGFFGELSVFDPLRAAWPAWAWSRAGQPRGQLLVLPVDSAYLKAREVLVYLPAGYDGRRPLVVCYAGLPVVGALRPVYWNMLDNLWADAGSPSAALVVVPVLSDNEIPTGGYDWADFVKDELEKKLSALVLFGEGPAYRVAALRGRGAGFQLVYLSKGYRHFGRHLLLWPELDLHLAALRQTFRWSRAGDLSGVRVRVFLGGPAGKDLDEVFAGLEKYKLKREDTFVIPAPGSIDADHVAALYHAAKEFLAGMK